MTANEDQELCKLLQQTCHVINRVREYELGKAGISRMKHAVLEAVKAAKEPPTGRIIARWLFREPHTISGLLDRMEKEDLVRRVVDLERKNVKRVVITEKGEKAYQQSIEAKAFRDIVSSLSVKERDALKSYLSTLQNKALEKLREQQPRRYVLPFP